VSQQDAGLRVLGTTTTDVRGLLVAAKRLAEAELGAQVITGWLCFCSTRLVRRVRGARDGRSIRSGIRKARSTAPTCARPASRSPASTFMEYRSAVNKPDSIGGARPRSSRRTPPGWSR
jgi:hypothetical protein